ncbi:MAG TPA: hypothetical protein PLC88_07375 [Syntrophomonas sp.]|jgi:hypothetical protein|nr:hypothetical protein [Syntrophomonas sp.]HRW12227.1 hypothetical protein [Syntrophomonas sp.]
MSGQDTGWANPSPAGLVALAVAVITIYATLAGKVDHTAAIYIAMWLLGGFVIQFAVAIIELKEGSLTGGNVFLFFAGMFMLSGAMNDVISFLAGINGITLQGTINGYGWLILTIALTTWMPAYLKTAPAVFSLTVVDLVVMAWCVTFIKLGLAGAILVPIAAYTALIAAVGALWCAAAFILNPAFGREIVSLGGKLLK